MILQCASLSKPHTHISPHRYTAVDNANRVSARVFRIIQVQDSRAPSLDVSGMPATLEAASHPWDSGPVASDTLDGSFSFFPRFSSRVRERVMRETLTCTAGRHVAKNCSICPESCVVTTVCNTSAEYETVAPTATTDRVCARLTDCGLNPLAVSPTPTTDRTCEWCSGAGGRFGNISTTSPVLGVSAELPYFLEPPNNNIPSTASCGQISVAALLEAVGVSAPARLAIFEISPQNFTLLSSTLPVGR